MSKNSKTTIPSSLELFSSKGSKGHPDAKQRSSLGHGGRIMFPRLRSTPSILIYYMDIVCRACKSYTQKKPSR